MGFSFARFEQLQVGERNTAILTQLFLRNAFVFALSLNPLPKLSLGILEFAN